MKTAAPPWRNAVGAIVVVLCLAVATGCTSSAGSASGATTTARGGVAVGTVVMVIRHGEKPAGGETGIDAQGNTNAHGLTTTGWERANRLVDLFDPGQGDPKQGLARPVAVYAARANDQGDGLRTRETVAPLAARLAVGVNTEFGKGEEQALVAQVARGPGPVLVSWQHEEITAIADSFPSVTPAPPTTWPDDRYDVVWTFTRTADGWSFAQVPELVLPGDESAVITG